MSSPLVSVVISSYNRPLMLRAAVLSAVAQTYRALEIIVQDDSTNEACREVVAQIADPRIRFTRNEPSLGTIGNLRAGYRKCTGKYFSTLNDDDLYAPEYIETMVDALESDSAFSVAFCDHWLIDGDGAIDQAATERNSLTFGRSGLPEGSVSNALETGLVAKSIPAMFAVFRASAVDLSDFPDEVSSGYDYWLTYLALRDGHSIYYSPRRLTSYRVHAGSQTSSFSDPEERIRSLAYSEYTDVRFLGDPRVSAIHAAVRKRLAGLYRSTAFTWLRLGKRHQAMRALVRSLETKISLISVAGCILCCLPSAVVRRVFRAQED